MGPYKIGYKSVHDNLNTGQGEIKTWEGGRLEISDCLRSGIMVIL